MPELIKGFIAAVVLFVLFLIGANVLFSVAPRDVPVPNAPAEQ